MLYRVYFRPPGDSVATLDHYDFPCLEEAEEAFVRMTGVVRIEAVQERQEAIPASV